MELTTVKYHNNLDGLEKGYSFRTFKGCQCKTLELKVNNSKAAMFEAFSNPFNNCQNFSISGFNSILDLNITHLQMKRFIRLLKRNLCITKPLLIVDVNAEYEEKIQSYFTVHSKLPYVSTNDSNMIIFIIKT